MQAALGGNRPSPLKEAQLSLIVPVTPGAPIPLGRGRVSPALIWVSPRAAAPSVSVSAIYIIPCGPSRIWSKTDCDLVSSLRASSRSIGTNINLHLSRGPGAYSRQAPLRRNGTLSPSSFEAADSGRNQGAKG